MSRTEWEMQSMARLTGARSVADMLERRTRERRMAALAAWPFPERRAGDRRA